MRGYFAIGVYKPKASVNIGTLWRSAYIFGASYIFTIGKRYQKQSSDTVKAFRHIPLWNFLTFEEFEKHIPYNARLICIEIDKKSESLQSIIHAQQAIYLLGAEDSGIPERILKKYQTIQIPSYKAFSLNVSTAGSIIMYDRLIKNDNHEKTIKSLS